MTQLSAQKSCVSFFKLSRKLVHSVFNFRQFSGTHIFLIVCTLPVLKIPHWTELFQNDGEIVQGTYPISEFHTLYIERQPFARCCAINSNGHFRRYASGCHRRRFSPTHCAIYPSVCAHNDVKLICMYAVRPWKPTRVLLTFATRVVAQLIYPALCVRGNTLPTDVLRVRIRV